MRLVPLRGAAVALVTALLLAGVAPAQSTDSINDYDPASVLVFPIYISDFTNGYASVVTTTNTNGDRRVVLPGNPSGLRGDVLVHYFWIDGTGTWDIFDEQALLTPNDTRAVLSFDSLNGTGNQDFEQGFLVAVAVDPETTEPIDFDYLIGDIVLVDVTGNRTWNLVACGIQSTTEENGNVTERTNRFHAYTDRITNGGDGAGDLDFDGIEYRRWPNLLYISSLFRQDNGVNGTNNDGEVILLTDLGRDFIVNLNMLFYDRDEAESSRTGTFTCWTRADLATLAAVTTTPAYNPAGWAIINSRDAVNPVTGQVVSDPNLLGAVVQRVLGQVGLEFGHLLHHTGLNPRNASMRLDF